MPSRIRRLLVLAVLAALALPATTAAEGNPEILSMDDGPLPLGWTARMATAEAALPAFDPKGYRRPDFLPQVYARHFDRVPARGLDNVRYWATAVADLAAACPGLGLQTSSGDALPYVFASGLDLFQRFRSGDLSDTEILQAGWMAILGLNATNACQWDPSGPISRDQAQMACDDAAAARSDLGVLPSLDASQDIALFLSRHACTSPQAAQLADGLRVFGRQAPGRLFRSAGLPPADLPEGAAYQEILQNCIRGSFSEAEYGWCGCYVDTLYALSPPRETVDALAQDPFADGTHIDRILALPGGDAVYDCADRHLRGPDSRQSYRDKPTACLIDTVTDAGGTDCVYRAAWGTFSLPGPTCRPQITSRSWGSVEVDCGKAGAPAAAVEGPRRWQNGVFTMIDWEDPVPDDFEPPLPEDARQSHPLEMRFLTREAPGQLTRMSLTILTEPDLFAGRLIMPNDPLFDVVAPTLMQIDREDGLILTCNWTTGQGTARRRSYWYQTLPPSVGSGTLDPRMAEALSQIGAPIETCPSRMPG